MVRFLPSPHDIIISCDLGVSDEKNLKYIVDTGAVSSIIKYEHIKKGTEVCEDETKFFGLIKEHFVKAIGKVTTSITIDDQLPVVHTFYIIKDDINIPNDGIIGSDFLRAYKARINYLREEIKFQAELEPKRTEVKDASTNTNDEHFLQLEKRVSILQEKILKVNTKQIIQKTRKKPKKVGNRDFYKNFRVENLSVYPKQILKVLKNDFKNIFAEKAVDHFLNFTSGEGNEISNSSDRVNFLKNEIDLSHCSQEEKNEMYKIFEEYNSQFNLPGDRFEHSRVNEHKIILKPNTKPVFQKQFRIPEHQRPELQRQLKEMEANGIIEKSDSPWNAPAFLVPKKEDTPGVKQSRLVIDYRELNKVIEPCSFPVPKVNEIIDKMNGARFFSTLDLAGAYHQIRLEKGSKQYTAFSTTYQKFQFTSVPFGLSTSPVALLKASHEIADEIEGVLVYMDDIVIFAGTLKRHMEILIMVFDRIREKNLKIKTKKSKFLLVQVVYLGFIISSEGLKTDPKKVEAIVKFPTPKTVKQIQRFLGICNYYRRYIPNYAAIAKCLYDLCKKDHPFNWTEECEKSFISFKIHLSNPPILIFPDFSQPFILQTDCSSLAASGILSQGEIPNDKPIHYFSKVLNHAQIRYSTIEKELLAIILSVEYFHYYLVGREFLIMTDHRPLTYLFENKNMNARLHRWRYVLMGYQFKIVYRSGKSNVVADALSRVKIDSEEDDGFKHLDFDLLFCRNIRQVTTRRQREKQLEEKIESEKPTEKANSKEQNISNELTQTEKETRRYFIKEYKDVILQSKEHNHIFSIVANQRSELYKKLQHKLKKQFVVENSPLKNKIYQIDDQRSLLFLDSNIRNNSQIEDARLTVECILQSCLNLGHENIAINIHFYEPFSHFQFKAILYDSFKDTTISISLFLNKIIEVESLEMIDKILAMYHDSLFGGHNGFERMKRNISRFYNWPGMATDIKNHVSKCSICECSKISKHTRSPMVITTIASEPFQKIYVDIVGPINPKSINGNLYILTCSCSLTKFVIAIPIPDFTALTTARMLVKYVFMIFGLPEIIVTDNGTNFISETLKQVNKLFKIKGVFTTPYHPQSNQVERYHRSLGNYLKSYIQKEKDRWCEFLHFAIFSYNNSCNLATGFSPFELIFGRTCKLPTEITNKPQITYNYENYASELRSKLKMYHDFAKEHLVTAKEKNKKYYDKSRDKDTLSLNKNDLILILKAKKNFKFEVPYEGPYRVIKEAGPVTVVYQKGRKSMKIHKDRVKIASSDFQGNIPPLIE